MFGKIRTYFRNRSSYGNNINAAHLDFLVIQKTQGIQPSDNESNKFLESFQRRYELCRRQLHEMNVTGTAAGIQAFSTSVDEKMKFALQFAEEYKEDRDSIELGACFGILMAAIQHGITSQYFDSAAFFNYVINSVKKIVACLWKINKNIRCKHIAARILKIGDENKENLHYNLYTELVNELSILFSEFNT